MDLDPNKGPRFNPELRPSTYTNTIYLRYVRIHDCTNGYLGPWIWKSWTQTWTWSLIRSIHQTWTQTLGPNIGTIPIFVGFFFSSSGFQGFRIWEKRLRLTLFMSGPSKVCNVWMQVCFGLWIWIWTWPIRSAESPKKKKKAPLWCK